MSTWTDKTSLRQPVSVVGTTPEQRRKARLEVARRSESVEDCRELLAMLGLIEVNS